MSVEASLRRLEGAIEQYRPALTRYLNPGLPPRQRANLMRRFRAPEPAAVFADLYGWRDGTRLTPEFVNNPALSIIAGVPFHFIDLELALAHFEHAREVAVRRPTMRHYAQRAIPFFWDGDRRWLCVDVASDAGPVLLAEHDANPPYQPLYSSFVGFVDDVIAALVSGSCPPRMRGLQE